MKFSFLFLIHFFGIYFEPASIVTDCSRDLFHGNYAIHPMPLIKKTVIKDDCIMDLATEIKSSTQVDDNATNVLMRLESDDG